MRLTSQSSQFIFNLPQNFVSNEIIEAYKPVLEKNWIQYENIIDYLNSAIKSVNFPGITFEMPEQIRMRGKVRSFKPSKNVQDILTTRELQVTFRSVDADLNYWIIFDLINKHYLDVENAFVNPFTITAVDIHRDALYVIKFQEIVLRSLSDNNFNYSQQKVRDKEFTLTFHFNFYDIEFLLTESKILNIDDGFSNIIQKI